MTTLLNNTETPIASAVSFRSEFLTLCAKHPGHTFLTLISEGSKRAFTLRQLRQRVFDYCWLYRRQGIAQGDIVLIVERESLDLFAAFFAGIIYGARPVYFAYPSEKQSKAAFLSSMDDLIRHNEIRFIVGNDDVIEILNRKDDDFGESFAGAINPKYVDFQRSDDLDLFPRPTAEGFLQFSSGTTGAKKGVHISAAAIFNQINAYAEFASFDHDSKVCSWLPHYHDMGLIACMLMPIFKGVPIVMMSPFEWVTNPAMLLDAIAAHKCTHTWQPNFAMGHLTRSISAQQAKRFDLSSLCKWVCCSEPVLNHTVNAFVKQFAPSGLDPAVIQNCYAMAENTFAMTSTRRGPMAVLEIDPDRFQQEHEVKPLVGGRPFVSAGEPLPNVEIKFLDGDGFEIEPDRVGEIAIRSNCMLLGYHNNPQATEAAFVDGWFKTGDLGFLHEGELYVTGRKKDLIIVGGENVYPQDIEAVLNAHPDLIPGRNVVFGVDDGRVGTERIIVLAETKGDVGQVNTQILREAVFDTVRVTVSDLIILPHMTLRKSTAGKVSRPLNKEAFLQGIFANANTNKTTIDKIALLKVVRSVDPNFPESRIDADAPLITTGLIDSFGFVELVGALEARYNLQIPPPLRRTENFDTIENMAATLQQLLTAGEAVQQSAEPSHIHNARDASLTRLQETSRGLAYRPTWKERLINHFPIRGSLVYRALLRLAGIQVGQNVTFLGRVFVKLRGNPANIVIGDDVIIGDGVDLRNRENGKISINDKAYLDADVRIVAARDGAVDVGIGTEIGCGTVINSGGNVTIGRFAMIAGQVNINSSSHGTQPDQFIKEQTHAHGVVEIGDDVWIGSGASILMNTHIGQGAVISSNSLVHGHIPPFAICAGVPAKILRYR
jgi:acyl-CoA synthetase (AMP-forming)/AMP-acid ligase II/acetyltransferase-like isoleucine patch superfamily enzyme